MTWRSIPEESAPQATRDERTRSDDADNSRGEPCITQGSLRNTVLVSWSAGHYVVAGRVGKRTAPALLDDEPIGAPVAIPEIATEVGQEATARTETQWRLLRLGSEMGLDVWVARNDRRREYDGRPSPHPQLYGPARSWQCAEPSWSRSRMLCSP